MTDMSKLSVAELREVQMKLADGEFPEFIETGMEAFDELADRYRRLEEAQRGVQTAEPFIVKHYTNTERPIIKGNGFDGLEIGESREEAEEFVRWINSRLVAQGAIKPPMSDREKALVEAVRHYRRMEVDALKYPPNDFIDAGGPEAFDAATLEVDKALAAYGKDD